MGTKILLPWSALLSFSLRFARLVVWICHFIISKLLSALCILSASYCLRSAVALPPGSLPSTARERQLEEERRHTTPQLRTLKEFACADIEDENCRTRNVRTAALPCACPRRRQETSWKSASLNKRKAIWLDLWKVTRLRLCQ